MHRVRQVEKSLLRFMLKPQLLTPIGAYYDNPVGGWRGWGGVGWGGWLGWLAWVAGWLVWLAAH